MAMREDCRHFSSRSYPGGETARFCILDLAPEAPWKCPDDCPKYESSLIDGTFEVGELTRTPVEAEPDESPDDIEAVLDEAEDIVNHAELDAARDVEGGTGARRWWPFGRGRRGRGDGGAGRLSQR
ncbi:MAG TPA: hypothetical protein VH914_08540 [Acidimicrobiia bacterium]|nr:hypothetical protein [Acidimicrobiia bacterium]